MRLGVISACSINKKTRRAPRARRVCLFALPAPPGYPSGGMVVGLVVPDTFAAVAGSEIAQHCPVDVFIDIPGGTIAHREDHDAIVPAAKGKQGIASSREGGPTVEDVIEDLGGIVTDRRHDGAAALAIPPKAKQGVSHHEGVRHSIGDIAIRHGTVAKQHAIGNG